MNKEFKNIQVSATVETEGREYVKTISSLPKVLIIRLNIIELIQLQEGMRLFAKQVKEANKTFSEKDSKAVLELLAAVPDESPEKEDDEEALAMYTISVERSVAKQLVHFLDKRMSECAHERDQRSDKFNPDTFIVQRYLMVTLKEAMLGSIEESLGSLSPQEKMYLEDGKLSELVNSFAPAQN